MGGPACDLIPAWMLFFGAGRGQFRAALEIDNATRARGRGWALSVALGAIADLQYPETCPTLAAAFRRSLDEVLAELPSGA